jgi:hypothetical protein
VKTLNNYNPPTPTPTPTPTPKFEQWGNTTTRTTTLLAGSHSAYVDICFKNVGNAGGYITLKCRFTQDNTVAEREQTVYITAGDRQYITFEFPEYSVWGGSWKYSWWQVKT